MNPAKYFATLFGGKSADAFDKLKLLIYMARLLLSYVPCWPDRTRFTPCEKPYIYFPCFKHSYVAMSNWSCSVSIAMGKDPSCDPVGFESRVGLAQQLPSNLEHAPAVLSTWECRHYMWSKRKLSGRIPFLLGKNKIKWTLETWPHTFSDA